MTLTTLPDHEPLAICLWDFTWYTRTGPGEPFEDLDRSCAETRGARLQRHPDLRDAVPAVRDDIDTTELELGPLPGGHGQRTRWYDVAGRTTIDARAI